MAENRPTSTKGQFDLLFFTMASDHFCTSVGDTEGYEHAYGTGQCYEQDLGKSSDFYLRHLVLIPSVNQASAFDHVDDFIPIGFKDCGTAPASTLNNGGIQKHRSAPCTTIARERA